MSLWAKHDIVRRFVDLAFVLAVEGLPGMHMQTWRARDRNEEKDRKCFVATDCRCLAVTSLFDGSRNGDEGSGMGEFGPLLDRVLRDQSGAREGWGLDKQQGSLHSHEPYKS